MGDHSTTGREAEHEVGVCAACGSHGPLVRCGSCDWSDRILATRAQRLLATLDPLAASGAYRRSGCRICPACRARFGPDMRCCPLRVLARGALTGEVRPLVARGHLQQLAALLGEELRRRGQPAGVEAYWARLLSLVVRVCSRRSAPRKTARAGESTRELRKATETQGRPCCPWCQSTEGAFAVLLARGDTRQAVMRCLRCEECYLIELSHHAQ
jgi:hypothetical protein